MDVLYPTVNKMNTYPATKASHLPEAEKEETLQEIRSLLDQGLMICVRLQTVECGEDSYETVYGVYGNTSEWVDNYNQSGGMWGYYSDFDFDN